jgi:hypothetical protein
MERMVIKGYLIIHNGLIRSLRPVSLKGLESCLDLFAVPIILALSQWWITSLVFAKIIKKLDIVDMVIVANFFTTEVIIKTAYNLKSNGMQISN